MAPKGPSSWKRPHTSIYNDNYRYGTGLYSDTLSDIEKRYSDSISRTHLRSDRPDIGFQTFAGSGLASSPSPAGDIADRTEKESPPPLMRSISMNASSPIKDIFKGSIFESRLNSALQSSFIDDEVADAISSRRKQKAAKNLLAASAVLDDDVAESSSARPKSLYDDAAFWAPSRPPADDSGKGKKSSSVTNGPRTGHWREKSNALQEQVEQIERSVGDCSRKLQDELSSLKSRYHGDLSALQGAVEGSAQHAADLQKLCKKQQNQMMELQTSYEDAQRNISDAMEEMNLWQNRCKTLKKDMDRLREEVETAVHKTSSKD